MSASFKASQVIRCPFCSVGTAPAHVGNGVLVCESCGQVFRVVHAQKGKTGSKLTRYVGSKLKWAPQ